MLLAVAGLAVHDVACRICTDLDRVERVHSLDLLALLHLFEVLAQQSDSNVDHDTEGKDSREYVQTVLLLPWLGLRLGGWLRDRDVLRFCDCLNLLFRIVCLLLVSWDDWFRWICRLCRTTGIRVFLSSIRGAPIIIAVAWRAVERTQLDGQSERGWINRR